ncbi:CRISPR-associated protein 1, variant 2 [Bonamia ostreae]|uniref:CRISPR-associated protein 1, variant 2 n=1 Tax=Bonamia ostreae TaxID=126728 RepID=A0ABV2AFB2_9EUKA
MWDYVWIAEDGMKMQGYNGSQLWDTAFAVMAILKHPNGIEFSAAIRKAYDYIKKTQVDDDVPYRKNFFRHRSKDMWPFSTKSHGWPISDCTSHALESVLLAHEKNVVAPKDRIPDERLKGAAKAIIAFQNEDGGYPTYEPKRGSSFLEYLNPAATFGKIMVDYSYVELTSSAVCALCLYAKTTEDELADGIRVAVGKAVKYIKSEQREDGSWYGSWGICFTYAIFFAVRALVAAGERNCREINKATQFLLGKQREDGGWGESYKSAETKEYVQLSSQVVNTSWALIALMEAGCEDVEAIERGIDVTFFITYLI